MILRVVAQLASSLVVKALRGRSRTQGLGTHGIGLAFECLVVVDAHTLHLRRGLHPALVLLNHVPGLVRQVLLLARGEVGDEAPRLRTKAVRPSAWCEDCLSGGYASS